MTAVVVRSDAGRLPLPDESVDLIVTSPPYFSLRDYGDGGASLAGQIGAEPTPQEYVAALIDCTREWVRVLKPTGSCFVNLGDAFSAGKPSGSADYQGVEGRGVRRPGARSEWTNANAAWLAAVLDCEGSVSGRLLKKEGSTGSFVAWMRVGMMDREVVERIYAITGVGRVFQDGRRVWNWHVASQAARYVLERIWPWLVIKQKRALAAIELCRHVEERAARGFRTLTADDLAYRTGIIQAIRDWNGHPARPNDYEPPRPPLIPLPDSSTVVPAKSLQLLPHRYAIACVDQLGLIVRQDQVWSKANGLPESVADRTRRSHEYFFHLTKLPRYFAAVDEIREAHTAHTLRYYSDGSAAADGQRRKDRQRSHGRDPAVRGTNFATTSNPRGKLPGSVWTIATEPLRVPEYRIVGRPGLRWVMDDDAAWEWCRHHRVWSSVVPRDDSRTELRAAPDHFAAFPTEWPRRLILGWSPSGVCTACGEGRRPVTTGEAVADRPGRVQGRERDAMAAHGADGRHGSRRSLLSTITGYACACTPYTDHPGTGESRTDYAAEKHLAIKPNLGRSPALRSNGQTIAKEGLPPKVGPWREYHLDGWTPPPTRPAVVLDPFGGTGTTAQVAAALGRTGITVDLSADYCRLAAAPELADTRRRKVLGLDKAEPVLAGQLDLLNLGDPA